MATGPADEHLRIGQLLAQTTRLFQHELFLRLNAAGLDDVRVAHTQVSAYIKADGSRLSDLAAWARMTRPAMSELVDDLERLGYVERKPDPSDKRAKLVVLTGKGWDAMRVAREIIEELEAEFAAALGAQRFAEFRETFQVLLDHLAEAAEA
jgi:DNA-binding MarR family transcriptional regulator